MAILNLEAAVRNVIGTDVQAYDAFLTSIAALGTVADKLIYTTAVDTAAETDLTAFARTILDDANEAAFKATVNLEIGTDVLAQQTIGIADNNLLEIDGSPNSAEYARFTANGLEGRTEAEFKGDFSLAIGTDVQAYDADLTAIAALSSADSNFIVGSAGGWVVESGATARASLGVAIGTDVQAWDAQLDDLAALDPSQDNNFIVSDGANWTQETVAQVRTTLGLEAGGAGDIWVEKAGDTITGLLTVNNALVYPMIISGSNASWAGFQQRATASGAKPYIEWNNSADNETAWIELDPSNQRLGFYYDNYWMTIEKDGDVRIGTAAAAARGQFEVDQASITGAQPVLLLDQADVSEEFINFTISGDQNMVLAKLSVTGNPTIEWNHSARAFAMSDGLRLTSSLTYPMIISGDDGSWVGFQQLATASGAKPYIEWLNSADSEQAWFELDPTNQGLGFVYAGTGRTMTWEKDGDVRIGTGGVVAARGQLEVDQASATGAQSVLLLDQADVSEEMIEFVSTIGVGNAIEAVGAKTLTTTHFLKVTLPGPLTRYIPVGTIA